MNEEYAAFLARKKIAAPMRGVSTAQIDLAPHLFPFQRDCVRFGIEAGSWGLFLDTGLGKTACELEWCRIAAEQSNKKALILAPLAVGHQIGEEASRWGYDARVVRDGGECKNGINIINYDRLRAGVIPRRPAGGSFMGCARGCAMPENRPFKSAADVKAEALESRIRLMKAQREYAALRGSSDPKPIEAPKAATPTRVKATATAKCVNEFKRRKKAGEELPRMRPRAGRCTLASPYGAIRSSK